MKWHGIAVPIGVMDVGLSSWTRCRRFLLNSVIHKSFPSALDLGSPGRTRSASGLVGLVAEVGQTIRQAMRVGGREHRRNAQLLSFAAAASQEFEVNQHARATDGGNQAADLGRPYLSECTRLPPIGTRSRSRNSRELDRSHAVPEHG